MMVAATTF